MARAKSIVAEKVDQAIRLLKEHKIDAWLTFVRETTEGGDPVLGVILGQNLTWQSALILTRKGDRVAIVGKYEDEAVRAGGVWDEVIPYVESVQPPLVETLKRLDPKTIAVNYSQDDVKADGLSHGMFLLLQEYLAGTPYRDRLVIAAQIIQALRGRKTEGELERLQQAVDLAEKIFEATARFARPGRRETEIAQFMRSQAAEAGAETAWDARQCPIVSSGPDSMLGHAVPSPKLKLEPGRILHIDFGVRKDGYCSDLQRAWYAPEPDEERPPKPVMKAFETVVRAIHAAADALKPGVEGWQVDQVARRIVVEDGYPEYQHATGHHVGRSAHDGGCVLGPQWRRYGRTPHYKVEPGNVFTLELGIDDVDGRGYLGLEEMVVVTKKGCEFLSRPQTALPLL